MTVGSFVPSGFLSLRISRISPFFLLLILMLNVGGAAAKDTLAILPFTGGQEDEGETIAELFSFQEELTAVFNPVPRTSINLAIQHERRFQMNSGMTDPDTIASLGKQLGAQYVVGGTITKLANRNLLIIAILKIDDLRQIAGDIQVYGTIGEIRDKLPAMAKAIAEAYKAQGSSLPMLAVPPVQLAGGIDGREADTLAQILAVHLIRNGKYVVYPRTKSLEQVQAEYGNQFGGDVADEYLPKLGAGDNPRLALSVKARTLGGATMFNAAVINLETGIQEAGDTADYQSLNDGMQVMEILALKLSGKKADAARLEKTLKNAIARADAAEEAARKKQEAEAEAARKWEAFKSSVAEAFRENYPWSYWSIGLNVGSTFATPGVTLSPNITIPIVTVAYLDLGCDFGFLSNADYIKDLSYNSYYPYIRASAFVPIDVEGFGFHIGLGYGCMIADYKFGDYDKRVVVSSFDVATGFLFINAIDISYSLRTDFKHINHKASIGLVFRLGTKKGK